MGFLAAEQDQISFLAGMAGYAFSNDHPEAYWVDYPNGNFIFDDSGQYIIKAMITPVEKFNGAFNDWETVQHGIERAVNEIEAMRASESRYDTVKAIHDYVCKNLSFHINYDEEYAGEQQTAAPIFGGGSIGKEAVCEGYSMSFKLLCDRFGIPAAVIGSRSHAFNYVQMDDGQYYAMDCLWDDQNPTIYQYFLVGYQTKLPGYTDGLWKFNSEFDHVEYWAIWQDGMDHAPFVYPAVSDQAYSRIEYLGDPEGCVSGMFTFRFKCRDYDFAVRKASIYIDDQLIGTSDIDENGLFELTYDSTELYNGYRTLKAVVGDLSYENKIDVRNSQFEILGWKGEVPTITEPYEVTVKGYYSGDISDCRIEVWLDYADLYSQKPFAASGFSSDGTASFIIDPVKCGDGLHQIRVVYRKPGRDKLNDYVFQYEQRSFRVSNTAADSGMLRFWGNSTKSDRNVGEWADFTLKYDGRVTENCLFSATIDDAPATPLRQGDDKITDFFDKDGFCTFYLDVNGLSNGKHTVQATLTKEDGSTVTASNTVYVTDEYCRFQLWKYNNAGELELYTDRNTAINGYVRMIVENISGEPAEKCRVWIYEDDMLTYDYDIKNDVYNLFFDDNRFTMEVSSPDVRFGKHVLKALFMTPDGTVVEKNLPLQLNPMPRFYDELHFSVNTRDSVRKVGKLADFTLIYDTPFPACEKLSITVDGKPADLQISANPSSVFDKFGRYNFTLSFSDKQSGEHTVEAVLTKTDGAVMKAEQKFIVTDDYFEVTNLPEALTDTVPVLNRVYDVKIKKAADTGETACLVRQYIDGEDMGAASFDKNGMATLGLNTAGLESGEHFYKVVFITNENVFVEKLMRFRVE